MNGIFGLGVISLPRKSIILINKKCKRTGNQLIDKNKIIV